MPPPRAVTGARLPSRDSGVPGTRLACGVTPGTRSLEPRPGGDAREVAGAAPAFLKRRVRVPVPSAP